MDALGYADLLRQSAQARFVLSLADEQQPCFRQVCERLYNESLAFALDQRAHRDEQEVVLGDRDRKGVG